MRAKKNLDDAKIKAFEMYRWMHGLKKRTNDFILEALEVPKKMKLINKKNKIEIHQTYFKTSKHQSNENCLSGKDKENE